jgi:hypothetical protein
VKQRLARVGLAALVCATLAGCGEREFDDQELIEELNAAGAGLVLGEPLPVTTDGVAVTTVSFEEPADAAAGDVHGAGALAVMDDEEAASAEFARCESAVDFTCFRAANAVLRFAGITPDERARLTAAMQSLEG